MPSLLSGRHSAVKVRKKLYVTARAAWGAEHDVADEGGQLSLAVAVARGGPVLADHVRLRVHDFVHHSLHERARQLPHVGEPVTVGGKLL